MMMPEIVIGVAAVVVVSAALWRLLRSERNADDALERAWTIARRPGLVSDASQKR